jgi:hypothetical protein
MDGSAGTVERAAEPPHEDDAAARLGEELRKAMTR